MGVSGIVEYDQVAARATHEQLVEAAALVPPGYVLPEVTRRQLVDAFARVTAPQDPEITIGLITVCSLHDAPKARSRKPGNILLNWRKLIEIIPDVSLAGLGASTLPVAPQVVMVLSALYIWNKVWRGAVEDLSDIEAVAILALWENRDERNRISEQMGYVRTNEVRFRYALPALTDRQFASAVNRLVELGCVELCDGVIWMREWVQKKYS